MNHTTTVRRAFEAAHQVEGHSLCNFHHGHRWVIEVSAGAGLHPKKIQAFDHGTLLSDLNRIVDEFADRDLDDMLPGTVTTPEGVGLYIRERLILGWPTLTTVVVHMGEFVTVTITAEIR